MLEWGLCEEFQPLEFGGLVRTSCELSMIMSPRALSFPHWLALQTTSDNRSAAYTSTGRFSNTILAPPPASCETAKTLSLSSSCLSCSRMLSFGSSSSHRDKSDCDAPLLPFTIKTCHAKQAMAYQSMGLLPNLCFHRPGHGQ